jgi:2-methylisocitrate lyase-like PEP mutase family enzyme
MASPHERSEAFAALHRSDTPLLLPNAWDRGSAKLFAELGFHAVATTSSRFAATLGRFDGNVTRDEAIAHGADLVAATGLPVSADLENGFDDDPAAAAETIALARAAGIAGGSIEDYGGPEVGLYEKALAVDRVAAAVEAAHANDGAFVLTARAENFIRGNPDLDDTIARLQAYQAAGADVAYAPGLSALDDIRAVVTAVDIPVNVLARPDAPTISELADAGVARVSVGGAFSYVAWGAVADAARELLDQGTYGFWQTAGAGAQLAKRALGR